MYQHNCPISTAVLPLHSRWTLPLLVELAQHDATFGTLKRALKPITSKTLTATLKKTRTATHITKDSTTYQLTKHGKRFLRVLLQLDKNETCKQCTGSSICLTNTSSRNTQARPSPARR